MDEDTDINIQKWLDDEEVEWLNEYAELEALRRAMEVE